MRPILIISSVLLINVFLHQVCARPRRISSRYLDDECLSDGEDVLEDLEPGTPVNNAVTQSDSIESRRGQKRFLGTALLAGGALIFNLVASAVANSKSSHKPTPAPTTKKPEPLVSIEEKKAIAEGIGKEIAIQKLMKEEELEKKRQIEADELWRRKQFEAYNDV